MAEALIRAMCAERGIKIEQKGLAYVLSGKGVSILCASLAVLQPQDLRPARGGEWTAQRERERPHC